MATQKPMNHADIYYQQIHEAVLLDRQQEIILAKRIKEGIDAANYFQEIDRAPLLDRQEEAILAERIKEGDNAQQILTKSNLRLVVSIAKKFVDGSRSLSLLDLIQEGNLGLMKAAKKFDWQKDCRFSTYARWWICRAIIDALKDKTKTIRIPTYLLEKISKYNRTKDDLSNKLGREASEREIIDELDWPSSVVCHVERINAGILSLESLIAEDPEKTISYFTKEDEDPPFNESESIHRAEVLKGALTKLSRREQEVLSLRYGLYDQMPQSLAKIAGQLKISKERIRQIQKEAERKLSRNEEISRLEE